eukprot:10123490-Alexandrium_andersonii.AAC.2
MTGQQCLHAAHACCAPPATLAHRASALVSCWREHAHGGARVRVRRTEPRFAPFQQMLSATHA